MALFNGGSHLVKKEKQSAFDRCMNYLSYRDRSESEMRLYLEKKNYPEQTIEETMDKLKYYGYINDANFVKHVCEANKQGKCFGRRRILQQLRQKGITKNNLALVDDFFSPEAEEKCCERQFEWAQKKYAGEPVVKQKQKISAYLARRGYTFDMIRPFLNGLKDTAKDTDHNNDGESDEQLARYYQKYYRMQSRKGYEGWELKQRIIRNLLSRGFDRERVRTIVESEEKIQ